MKKNIQRPAFKLALCAVIAALEVLLMMASGLFRIGTYALPCFAGMLSVAIVIEYNCKWAFGVYAVSAILSFFLTADKEAALLFILFFGYYPILKNILDRHVKSVVLSYIIKFALFNAAAVGSFFAATYLFMIPAEEFTLFGVYVPFVFLLLGNVFFFIYDIAVNVFVKLYVQRLRKALFGRFH